MATIDGFILPCDVIQTGECPDATNRDDMAASGVAHELGVRHCEAAAQILGQRGVASTLKPGVCPRIVLNNVENEMIGVQHA